MATHIHSIRRPHDAARALRALRLARQLTQQRLGDSFKLTQARVSQIELKPGVTSLAQVLRVLEQLNGLLVIAYVADDKMEDEG
jgi:transcriptional regulator with XRE-family HTH domain